MSGVGNRSGLFLVEKFKSSIHMGQAVGGDPEQKTLNPILKYCKSRGLRSSHSAPRDVHFGFVRVFPIVHSPLRYSRLVPPTGNKTIVLANILISDVLLRYPG